MGKGLIWIRPCKESDCRFLWNLRNEKTARESAFNKNHILYRKHMQWFKKKMADGRSHIYIVMKQKRRIGQVRFDWDARKNAEIDIGIVKKERGKGAGTRALKQACLYGLKKLGLKRITAYVKKENTPSLRAFENANFSNKGIPRFKKEATYKMVLK